MSTLFTLPAQAAFDSSGDPLAGGRLYFYATGTSTPLATYQDVDLNTAHANPVVADAYGVFPAIWLSSSTYRITLKDSGGVTKWTVDGVQQPSIGADDVLPAANLTGTVAVANLPSTVAFYNATGKTYTGTLTFSGIVSHISTLNYLGYEVGWRDIPQSVKSAAYTLVYNDRGLCIAISSGGVTIPPNVFTAGAAISVYNNSAASQTITAGTGVTLRLVATATTGNRTLAQRGLATILCVGSNEFVISGGGVS